MKTFLLFTAALLTCIALAHCDEREAAYDYLTNSVARSTRRSPAAFTTQTNLVTPKVDLTNRAEVVKRLTLGGTILVRPKTAVVGDPLGLTPREYPVLTRAQALIWQASTNRHP